MLTFNRITIEDRERLLPLLMEKDRGCEYTFSNLYLYRHFYDTNIAYHNDSAVVSFGNPGLYLMPLGSCDLKEIVEELPAGSDGNRHFVCITNDDLNVLADVFGDRVISVEKQTDGEYVYRSSDLADLPGKKYHSKRNHCTRFERLYSDWSFEKIGTDNIAEAAAMNAAWYAGMSGGEDDLREDCACSAGSLCQFDRLGLTGALLRVGGKVVAWCCGEEISAGSFCTHVEKAMRDVDGAYSVINREFAMMLRDRFEFINREDDAGDEGLRRTKLSYEPVYILEKNRVVIS
jgi:hypothetical protein